MKRLIYLLLTLLTFQAKADLLLNPMCQYHYDEPVAFYSREQAISALDLFIIRLQDNYKLLQFSLINHSDTATICLSLQTIDWGQKLIESVNKLPELNDLPNKVRLQNRVSVAHEAVRFIEQYRNQNIKQVMQEELQNAFNNKLIEPIPNDYGFTTVQQYDSTLNKNLEYCTNQKMLASVDEKAKPIENENDPVDGEFIYARYKYESLPDLSGSPGIVPVDIPSNVKTIVFEKLQGNLKYSEWIENLITIGQM